MKAHYCKCSNTYTINKCECENVPYYWYQGIGSLTGQNGVIEVVRTFDYTFDDTFF
jgi:hypothetical protein